MILLSYPSSVWFRRLAPWAIQFKPINGVLLIGLGMGMWSSSVQWNVKSLLRDLGKRFSYSQEEGDGRDRFFFLWMLSCLGMILAWQPSCSQSQVKLPQGLSKAKRVSVSDTWARALTHPIWGPPAFGFPVKWSNKMSLLFNSVLAGGCTICCPEH